MLSTLRQIVEEISRIPVLEEALQCVAKRLQQAMAVDCCAIYLADYQEQNFILVATEGLAPEAIGVTRVGFSEGLIGLIGQREEPINIDDAQVHPRFKHYPDVKEDAYHAFLGTPIIHQRKVLGVISVQQKTSRRFAEEEEALLITLAAQMALEVANAEARGLLNIAEEKKGFRRQGIIGNPGSPGLAIGIGYSPVVNKANLKDFIATRTTKPAIEVSKYREAVVKTKKDIEQLTKRVEDEVPQDVANIFHLYDHLLDAASLGKAVEDKIHSGWSAASALKQVVESYEAQFSQMSDPYMRERAVDVVDLGNRVFTHLINIKSSLPPMPDKAILVAHEVTATMLADIPREKLVGVISVKGANNSHAAILARAVGVPAVMGINDVPASLFADKEILLDGYAGEITVSPDGQQKQAFETLITEESELQHLLSKEEQLPATTLDEKHIALFSNIGLSKTLQDTADDRAADGVGLYRTEIPFMQHDRFPSEQQQMQLYRNLLVQFRNKPVTMRTLDVGGDKPLPYFPFQEENPFLGWRGIRLTLDHPEIFLVQVRAMLRASLNLGNLSIMLPMVTSVDEVRESKRLIRQAFYEVSEEAAREQLSLTKPKIGVMLEVPAILYQLPKIAELVDFFSVGSNDLTQYLLAVDRNNARVSDLYDSYHPAVLHALNDIAQRCRELNKPVTVCGEMAGEPGGVLLLIAMGYDKLSLNSSGLSKVRWIIRRTARNELSDLLQSALECSEASEIKSLVSEKLEMLGMGGLVRAGL
ncbi:MAG: phosphoenolpyruvate--protein phosphotransferase [Alteromonadaceae bacterium]|nr:phosphoenolpyruvate--protein phosphotransferase [Alteromonadaceae bacterium]